MDHHVTRRKNQGQKHAHLDQKRYGESRHGRHGYKFPRKENLRHRILRLRLQLEGSTDDSINSIIKRLTKETKRLNIDLEMTSFNYKSE